MPDYEKIAASLPDPAPREEVRKVHVKIPKPKKAKKKTVERVIPPEELQRAEREFLPVTHPKYQGLATDKGYDQSYGRIKRTHYSHEAMIDILVANPAIKQNDLAKTFDKSVAWISRILGSDAFQAALAKRREELTDPFLVATIEERMRGLAFQSLDIITEKLEQSRNTDLALKSLDISAKALGFGARGGGGSGNQTQFIIQLPPKSDNASDWMKSANPRGSNG